MIPHMRTKTQKPKTARTASITDESLKAIRVELPPEIREFVTEAFESVGLDYDEYIESFQDLIRRDIRESFTTPRYGVREYLSVEVGPECLLRVNKVIEKWRGNLAIA